jgi:hypothetical protein
VLSLIVAAIWPVLLAQATAAPAGDADALRQLTVQRFAANAANDRAFYERLLSPAFQLLDPFGFPPAGKQAYLDAEFPAGRPRRPPGRSRTFAPWSMGIRRW